jgi:hypothetical protein
MGVSYYLTWFQGAVGCFYWSTLFAIQVTLHYTSKIVSFSAVYGIP